jgi:hypothetical protein
MPVVNVTPPSVEPLTLKEALWHLREDDQSLDTQGKVTLAIKATRELAENATRRAFITQKWRATLDEFPRPSMNISSATWYGPQWGTTPGPLTVMRPDGTTGYEIWLPFPRLQAVTLLQYIDTNGVTQTMNVGTDLLVDTVSEPGRIMPAFNTVWPETRKQANAITIEWTCGYGDTADLVPSCVKQWMLAVIGTVYEHRESEVIVARGRIEVMGYVDRLLDPIRVLKY